MLTKVKRIKLGKQIYRRLMKRVLERDGWRCQKCGSLENLQVHHQIKRSQQGNDSLENLVTLSAHCHMAEHGQLLYSVPAAKLCSKTQPLTRCKSHPQCFRDELLDCQMLKIAVICLCRMLPVSVRSWTPDGQIPI